MLLHLQLGLLLAASSSGAETHPMKLRSIESEGRGSAAAATAALSHWQRNASRETLGYIQTVATTTLLPSYCNVSSPKVHWDVGHAQIWAECAALRARLWVLGGKTQPALVAGALQDLRQLAAQLNATRTADFFTVPATMLACKLTRNLRRFVGLF